MLLNNLSEGWGGKSTPPFGPNAGCAHVSTAGALSFFALSPFLSFSISRVIPPFASLPSPYFVPLCVVSLPLCAFQAFRTVVLVSESTFFGASSSTTSSPGGEGSEQVEFRKLGRVSVPGKAEVITVYEPLLVVPRSDSGKMERVLSCDPMESRLSRGEVGSGNSAFYCELTRIPVTSPGCASTGLPSAYLPSPIYPNPNPNPFASPAIRP